MSFSNEKASSHKVTIFAAKSKIDNMSYIISWSEEGSFFENEAAAVGSSVPADYGLDEPPGFGIWAFEGQLSVTGYLAGDPIGPSYYEPEYHWEGAWRLPTDDEWSQWGAFKATHVTDAYEGRGVKEDSDRSREEAAARSREVIINWSLLEHLCGKRIVNAARAQLGDNSFCLCGKLKSECCCGEARSTPHHPSGRAYDEEDWEQFAK